MRCSMNSIVILGGGTAGWMTAALLSKVVSGGLEIELVESEQIDTVGVGEATIPQIRYLCDALRIPEADFLAEVNGTYKLGIEFVNWARAGDRYIHTFGDVGRRLGVLDFHHVWVRARELGIAADLGDYSFNALAAHANRFAPVEKLGETGLLGIGYAFHFDATRVAGLLRRISEKQGARRTEGRVERVELNPETGFIEALRLVPNLNSEIRGQEIVSREYYDIGIAVVPIVPGAVLRDDEKGFDFSSAPASAWWEFDRSPLNPSKDGEFLEIAITPLQMVSITSLLMP